LAAILQRVLSADSSESLPQTGIALLRIATGAMIAVLHGWHKVAGGWQYARLGTHWPLLDDTVKLGFPMPVVFTALAAATQLVGGVMLALGMWTRVAALLVGSTLVTALAFNLKTGGPDAQLAGVYSVIMGAFVLIGGGRWSVDRRLSRAVQRADHK
jgi:putative oxidoreductase